MDKYHWDVVGCFIWDLSEMSWRRTDWTSSFCPPKTSSRHTNKTSWRRTTETSLGVSFETYLPRCWDVQRDVITRSLRRLVAGWVVPFVLFFPEIYLIHPNFSSFFQNNCIFRKLRYSLKFWIIKEVTCPFLCKIKKNVLKKLSFWNSNFTTFLQF